MQKQVDEAEHSTGVLLSLSQCITGSICQGMECSPPSAGQPRAATGRQGDKPQLKWPRLSSCIAAQRPAGQAQRHPWRDFNAMRDRTATKTRAHLKGSLLSFARANASGILSLVPMVFSMLSTASLAPPCAGPHRAAMPEAMQAKGLAWLDPVPSIHTSDAGCHGMSHRHTGHSSKPAWLLQASAACRNSTSATPSRNTRSRQAT